MRMLLLIVGSAFISITSSCGGKSRDDAVAINTGGTAAFGNSDGGAAAYALGGTWSTGGTAGTATNTLPDWDANCVRTIPLTITEHNLATCAFDLPPVGEDIDLNYTNLVFVSDAGTQSEMAHATDVTGESCGTSARWYADNRLLPEKILLCPAACDAVKAGTASELQLVIGCHSVPLFN